jgi:LAGLIDADG DNA endonuclease family
MKKTIINYNINSLNLNNNSYVDGLPKELQSIFIGLMLGDGSLYKSSSKSNARFEMSFGQKYKDYAENLELLFKEYIKNPLKKIEIKNKDKVYINYRLKTRSLRVFTNYYDIFYLFDSDLNKCVKIVPKTISELMNFTVLAYLIMSDGNFDKSRNRIRIYTNSYKKEEVENLASAISINLNIKTSVLYDRKDQ